MRKVFAGLSVMLITALAATGCNSLAASGGSGGGASAEGGGISARGAIGAVAADTIGPLYEDDGGAGIRLAVLAPEVQGAAPEYLPVYTQGLLNNNFKKYSSITLIDRQNLDKIIAEQDLAAKGGRFSDADFIKIGGLTNANYFLFGTIQKMSGDQYALRLTVTGSSTGDIKADCMRTGSLARIENGSLLNEASAELLAQLGVRLTDAGRASLLAGSAATARAQTVLAKGITAQAGGETVEALFNFTQAASFDPSGLEALARLNTLSSSISGGSLSERIMNDIQARDRWLAVFKEAARFYNEHPPFEITFDPALLQEGETDYAKRTANLAMRLSLAPSEAGFAALNALVEGLKKTGRRGVWGFNGWPLLDLTPKTPEAVVFGGRRSISFKVDIELLNDKGKSLSKSSVTLNSGNILFSAGSTNITPPKGIFTLTRFPNVKADDLTPDLTISITAVNGIPAAKLNDSGYMKIDAGNLEGMKEIAEYTQMIQRNPNNDSAYFGRAFAYSNRGDYDKAIADYTEAIRLNPNNARRYNARGYAYAYKGDYVRALADINQAIKLAPTDSNYYDSRGEIYFMQKDYNRSIADYEYALRLDPNFANAKEMLQKVRQAQGR